MSQESARATAIRPSDACSTPKRFLPFFNALDGFGANRACESFLREASTGHDLDDWLQPEQEWLDAAESHVDSVV